MAGGGLRREIKDAARQVLNREFELYELRKSFATWMISRGVPELIVSTLQGTTKRVPSPNRALLVTETRRTQEMVPTTRTMPTMPGLVSTNY